VRAAAVRRRRVHQPCRREQNERGGECPRGAAALSLGTLG
jgi:hypothetical protein